MDWEKKAKEAEARARELKKKLTQVEADAFNYSQQSFPGMGEDTKGINDMQYRYAVLRALYPNTGKYTDRWCGIKAGYKEKNVDQILTSVKKNPIVKKIINRARAKQVDKLKLTSAEVIGDIMTIKDRAMGKLPYFTTEIGSVEDGTDENGNIKFKPVPYQVMRQDYEPKGALKSAELLGKYLKLWTDKTEITGKDGKPIEVTQTHRRVSYVMPDKDVNKKETAVNNDGA